MTLFFELVAFALTGLCVYHSLKLRGKEFTALFFIPGFLLGILRENIVSSFTNLYSYNSSAFTFWIGSAPLLLGVFWSYTIYFSLSLSEDIARWSLTRGERVEEVLLLAAVFMAAYSCLNEDFASLYSMVLWKFVPRVALWGGTPLVVPFGYAGMALIFLSFLKAYAKRGSSLVVKLTLMSASVFIMIVLHLLLIGAIKFLLDMLL